MAGDTTGANVYSNLAKSRKIGLKITGLTKPGWISGVRPCTLDKVIYPLGQAIGITRNQPDNQTKPKYGIAYLKEFYCGYQGPGHKVGKCAIISIAYRGLHPEKQTTANVNYGNQVLEALKDIRRRVVTAKKLGNE